MPSQNQLNTGDLISVRGKDYLVIEYRKVNDVDQVRQESWPSVKIDVALLPKRTFGQLPHSFDVDQKDVKTFHLNDLSSTHPAKNEISINTNEVKVFGRAKTKVNTQVIHHVELGKEKNYDNIDRRNIPTNVSKGTRAKKVVATTSVDDMSLD